jgi:hypothetical protein
MTKFTTLLSLGTAFTLGFAGTALAQAPKDDLYDARRSTANG